jgi:hypothetical protein
VWRIGIEHFCLACHKQHKSTVWYYRPSVEGVTKEWICCIKYLALGPEVTELWQTIPMLEDWAKHSENPT